MNDPLKNRVDYLLKEWVEINSFTDNRRGVREVQDRIEDEAANLGLHVDWVARATGSESDEPNHLLRLSHNSADHLPLVTLVAAVDTVFPEDSPFQLITWASGRNRAIGPGVVTKGAVLTALLCLERVAAAAAKASYRLEALVLPNREAGSAGFEEILRGQGQNSAIVLGLDPALPNGSILHSRGGLPEYALNPESENAAKIAIKLIEHHEKRKVAARMSPEPSPCNHLYREGIPVLDGLGPVGNGLQSHQETVEMPTVFSRADIILDLLENWVP